MNYSVVSQSSVPLAVVFHDYRTGYYVVHSKSENFRQAFMLSAKYLAEFRLSRVDEKVARVFAFGVDDPLWLNAVLDRVCVGYWVVDHRSVFEYGDSIESICDKFLV